MKENPTVVLAAWGGEADHYGRAGRVVARQRGRRWRLYVTNDNERFAPIDRYGASRYRRDSCDDMVFESLDETARYFGGHLCDWSVLFCAVLDYRDYRKEDNIVHPVALQGFRRRRWSDAAEREAERLYWVTCEGVCARTEDKGIVIEREHGIERPVRPRRDKWGDHGYAVNIIGDHIPIDKLPLAEAKEFARSSEPDCYIEQDGEWMPLKSLKAIKAACRTPELFKAAA